MTIRTSPAQRVGEPVRQGCDFALGADAGQSQSGRRQLLTVATPFHVLLQRETDSPNALDLGFDLDTREWDIVDQVIPVPLPVGQSDLTKNNWIPRSSTLNEDPTKIRRYSSFRAYHDNGYFDEFQMSYDSRLVGRSVWQREGAGMIGS